MSDTTSSGSESAVSDTTEASTAEPAQPDWYRPTRGYSWPPFEPGHTLSLRHGAYSPRKVDPLAAEIYEAIVASAPWLHEADGPALRSLARAEARVQLLAEYIDEHGPLDSKGKPRPALEAQRVWEGRASAERDRLGLTPLSRARLGRDVAGSQLDVARMMAVLAEEAEATSPSPSTAAHEEHEELEEHEEHEDELQRHGQQLEEHEDERHGQQLEESGDVGEGHHLQGGSVQRPTGTGAVDGVPHPPDSPAPTAVPVDGVPHPPDSPAPTAVPTPSENPRDHQENQAAP